MLYIIRTAIQMTQETVDDGVAINKLFRKSWKYERKSKIIDEREKKWLRETKHRLTREIHEKHSRRKKKCYAKQCELKLYFAEIKLT